MTAGPSEGYQFDKWSGDVDTGAVESTAVSVIMNKNRTVTANFTAPGGLCTVSLATNPAWGGSASIVTSCDSITADNDSPSVSVQCLAGTELTLQAVPVQGYRFRGWKGDLSSSHDDVDLLVDSSKTITAKFAKPPHFQWLWVVVGEAASLAVLALVAALIRLRDKSQMDSTSDGA